jgi:CDP-diacylglycerol---glycerol-3-phosphate 3-phosphatidyltransferase
MFEMNLAIWITVSRFILLPVAILPVIIGFKEGWLICAVATQLAGLSDFADGIVARRFGSVTQLGTNLDFFGDKFFVSGTLIVMSLYGLVPAWIPVVIVIREIAVSTLRFRYFGWDTPSADNWGKLKTTVSYTALIWTALNQNFVSGGALSLFKTELDLKVVLAQAHWIMLAAVILTLLSGANYFWKYSR